MEPQRIKDEVVQALEEVKGEDIQVLDVRHLTTLCDYLVLACAKSNRQTRALAHRVENHLRAHHVPIQGLEGLHSGEWILVDLGSVIVHIMQPGIREYFNLDELWGGTRYLSQRPPIHALVPASTHPDPLP